MLSGTSNIIHTLKYTDGVLNVTHIYMYIHVFVAPTVPYCFVEIVQMHLWLD